MKDLRDSGLLEAHATTDSQAAVRGEIAALAAAMIAEEGLDYGTAKYQALKRILNPAKRSHAQELMPSNDEVLEALREYQATYLAEEQTQRLYELRIKARELLVLLNEFSPKIMGAIANGTADQHSSIHVVCHAESAKEIGIFLLNHGISNEATSLASGHYEREPQEALTFRWLGEYAAVTIEQKISAGFKRKENASAYSQRLDLKALEVLIQKASHD
jgi:hypothetical protein